MGLSKKKECYAKGLAEVWWLDGIRPYVDATPVTEKDVPVFESAVNWYNHLKATFATAATVEKPAMPAWRKQGAEPRPSRCAVVSSNATGGRVADCMPWRSSAKECNQAGMPGERLQHSQGRPKVFRGSLLSPIATGLEVLPRERRCCGDEAQHNYRRLRKAWDDVKHKGPDLRAPCGACNQLGHHMLKCPELWGPHASLCMTCGQRGHGSETCPWRLGTIGGTDGHEREPISPSDRGKVSAIALGNSGNFPVVPAGGAKEQKSPVISPGDRMGGIAGEKPAKEIQRSQRRSSTVPAQGGKTVVNEVLAGTVYSSTKETEGNSVCKVGVLPVGPPSGLFPRDLPTRNEGAKREAGVNNACYNVCAKVMIPSISNVELKSSAEDRNIANMKCDTDASYDLSCKHALSATKDGAAAVSLEAPGRLKRLEPEVSQDSPVASMPDHRVASLSSCNAQFVQVVLSNNGNVNVSRCTPESCGQKVAVDVTVGVTPGESGLNSLDAGCNASEMSLETGKEPCEWEPRVTQDSSAAALLGTVESASGNGVALQLETDVKCVSVFNAQRELTHRVNEIVTPGTQGSVQLLDPSVFLERIRAVLWSTHAENTEDMGVGPPTHDSERGYEDGDAPLVVVTEELMLTSQPFESPRREVLKGLGTFGRSPGGPDGVGLLACLSPLGGDDLSATPDAYKHEVELSKVDADEKGVQVVNGDPGLDRDRMHHLSAAPEREGECAGAAEVLSETQTDGLRAEQLLVDMRSCEVAAGDDCSKAVESSADIALSDPDVTPGMSTTGDINDLEPMEVGTHRDDGLGVTKGLMTGLTCVQPPAISAFPGMDGSVLRSTFDGNVDGIDWDERVHSFAARQIEGSMDESGPGIISALPDKGSHNQLGDKGAHAVAADFGPWAGEPGNSVDAAEILTGAQERVKKDGVDDLMNGQPSVQLPLGMGNCADVIGVESDPQGCSFITDPVLHTGDNAAWLERSEGSLDPGGGVNISAGLDRGATEHCSDKGASVAVACFPPELEGLKRRPVEMSPVAHGKIETCEVQSATQEEVGEDVAKVLEGTGMMAMVPVRTGHDESTIVQKKGVAGSNTEIIGDSKEGVTRDFPTDRAASPKPSDVTDRVKDKTAGEPKESGGVTIASDCPEGGSGIPQGDDRTRTWPRVTRTVWVESDDDFIAESRDEGPQMLGCFGWKRTRKKALVGPLSPAVRVGWCVRPSGFGQRGGICDTARRCHGIVELSMAQYRQLEGSWYQVFQDVSGWSTWSRSRGLEVSQLGGAGGWESPYDGPTPDLIAVAAVGARQSPARAAAAAVRDSQTARLSPARAAAAVRDSQNPAGLLEEPARATDESDRVGGQEAQHHSRPARKSW